MFTHIRVRRLTTSSVFKLLAIGTVYSFVPFGVLTGLLATIGLPTVSVGGTQITGPLALIVAPLVALFAALVTTLWLGFACSFGIWLNSKFDVIRLDVIAEDEERTAAQPGVTS